MTQEKGPGRPSKITPEITEEICDYIKAGNYPETAAALAGIHRATFYRWIKKGNQHKTGLHREFCDRIKEAEAYAQGAAVERIRKAGDKNWQALAWWLERKFPELWGRKDRLAMEHSGHIGNKEKSVERVDKVKDLFALAAQANHDEELGLYDDPVNNDLKPEAGEEPVDDS